MNIIGEVALWTALPVAIWGMVLGFVGGQNNRGDLVLSAERAVYATLALCFLASLGVIDTFLHDRFEYWYVASYSSLELGTFYKVSGLWAGQRGSLLFWQLLLCLFSAIAVWSNRKKNREFMPNVIGTLMVIQVFFLVVLLFADVNPFERLPGGAPPDGRGLNPQLQNYWMTIHPPTLYLGFTAFTIPFAFGVSALLTGRLDSRWIQVTRKWTLLSWFFLSNGIVFGMRWAYEELGWGGYWFWDPVENASLLPWLTATAFLHSIQIQENRGMLKIWNMGLVLLTFLLTIFATFLTRSGLIESVHVFAQELKIAYIFLSFMFFIAASGLILVLYRLPKLKSESQIESFFSREAAFLFNNLVLLAATFAVLWGTLLPLISEGFMGQAITVGPPFFNRVNLPIGLFLLFLMGVGPVIAWRRATKKNLRRNFMIPVSVGLGTGVVLYSIGIRHGMALTTFATSAFVMATIITEFWKGTRARARIEGRGFILGFYHLVTRNRRRWGGYIVHVGIVMIFTAFAAEPWYVEIEQTMQPGQSTELQSPLGTTYRLTYEGMSTSRDSNENIAWRAIALFSLQVNGEPAGTMTTEKRAYLRPNDVPPSTEVGIRSTLAEDLYITLADADLEGIVGRNDPSAQEAHFGFMVKPLVGLIWGGIMVLSVGGLIGLWPGAEKPRSANAGAKKKAEPVAAGAGD